MKNLNTKTHRHRDTYTFKRLNNIHIYVHPTYLMNLTPFQLTIANLVVSVALLLVVGSLVLFITLFKSQPEEPGKIETHMKWIVGHLNLMILYPVALAASSPLAAVGKKNSINQTLYVTTTPTRLYFFHVSV